MNTEKLIRQNNFLAKALATLFKMPNKTLEKKNKYRGTWAKRVVPNLQAETGADIVNFINPIATSTTP